MNIYEIARLRVVAMGLDQDKRFLINKAADALENQQREIEALRKICEKQAEMNGRIAAMALELDTVKEELDKYRKAEDDGRLVVLPCKVGDPYFTIERICNCGGEEEEWSHHWGSDCEFCFVPCNARKEVRELSFCNIQQIIGYSGSIGKTVFLTREEAEAALKGDNHES